MLVGIMAQNTIPIYVQVCISLASQFILQDQKQQKYGHATCDDLAKNVVVTNGQLYMSTYKHIYFHKSVFDAFLNSKISIFLSFKNLYIYRNTQILQMWKSADMEILEIHKFRKSGNIEF